MDQIYIKITLKLSKLKLKLPWRVKKSLNQTVANQPPLQIYSKYNWSRVLVTEISTLNLYNTQYQKLLTLISCEYRNAFDFKNPKLPKIDFHKSDNLLPSFGIAFGAYKSASTLTMRTHVIYNKYCTIIKVQMRSWRITNVRRFVSNATMAAGDRKSPTIGRVTKAGHCRG